MDENSQETDVNTESSSPASEPASSAPDQSGTEPQEAAPTPTQEANIPFHEHPRFKEVIEQKNTFQRALQETQSQMQQMQQSFQQEMQRLQSQLQPKQPAFDPNKFVERAKSIDPEFAQTLQYQMEAAQRLQSEFESMKNERLRESAMSKLSSLYETNKVPANLRPQYERAIKAAAYENPKFQLNDLESLFKQTHEEYTKFLDDIKRSERASYVQAKKTDVTPASQTGGAAPATGKGLDLSSFDKRVEYLANEMRRSKQKI